MAGIILQKRRLPCMSRDTFTMQDSYVPPTASTERRSYDLYITYSKFYQVPQFWLVGFSVDKTPLTMKEVRVHAAHVPFLCDLQTNNECIKL